MSETVRPNRYFIGEDVRLRARFFGEDGVTPISATGVRILVLVPGTAEPIEYAGLTIVEDGEGSFYVDHRVTASGRHRWRGECTGPTAGVDEGAFDGVRSAVL